MAVKKKSRPPIAKKKPLEENLELENKGEPVLALTSDNEKIKDALDDVKKYSLAQAEIPNDVEDVERKLNNIHYFQSYNKNRANQGVVSITYTEKFGNRLKLAKKLLQTLGHPAAVNIGYIDEYLVIRQKVQDLPSSFELKKGGMIYSTDLLQKIVEFFELDFSNRTCMTFTDVHYVESNGQKVAMVRIKGGQFHE